MTAEGYDPGRELADYAASCDESGIRDLERLLNMRDSSGRMLFDPDDEYSAYTVRDILKAGAGADDVEALLAIADGSGAPYFTESDDLATFISAGGTANYARHLFSLADSEGFAIFNGWSAMMYKLKRGTLRYAEELTSLLDTEGNVIFFRGGDVLEYFHGNRGDKGIALARKLVRLKDEEGKSVFRDGRDIVAYLHSQDIHDKEGNIDYLDLSDVLALAKRYLQIQDLDGRQCFDGHGIATLSSNRVPPEFAEEMAPKGMNALTILYYYGLALEPGDTAFTGENGRRCLALLPTWDSSVPFYWPVFSCRQTAEFLGSLRSVYDLRVRAISTLEEMCAEIERTPDVDLLVLAGHGKRDSLMFGKSTVYDQLFDDSLGELTTASESAARYFAMLPEDATVFLDSCSNGEGRDSGDNLANAVAGWAPGRTVIASTADCGPDDITFESLVPFRLSIRTFSPEGEEMDSTYVARKRPKSARASTKGI